MKVKDMSVNSLFKNMMYMVRLPFDEIYANVEVWREHLEEIIQELESRLEKYQIVRCKRCEYVWIPKTKKIPRMCPECKSVRWND